MPDRMHFYRDCLLQIPAFLCRQTDLIEAAARTGANVNLKKGQFLSPAEMGQVVNKAATAGGKRLLLTDRGTTFGYNNLVADMRAIPVMQGFGFPVVFDATHSVQMPGGGGDRSAGNGEFAPVLAKAAVAALCLGAPRDAPRALAALEVRRRCRESPVGRPTAASFSRRVPVTNCFS